MREGYELLTAVGVEDFAIEQQTAQVTRIIVLKDKLRAFAEGSGLSIGEAGTHVAGGLDRARSLEEEAAALSGPLELELRGCRSSRRTRLPVEADQLAVRG